MPEVDKSKHPFPDFSGFNLGLKIKTPPLPCAAVPVNFGIIRDGADGFRRPVKVSATITAGVPDRVIPIQGPSCESRAGQGKSDFQYFKDLLEINHDSCQSTAFKIQARRPWKWNYHL
jgi:hypothetical protein